MENHPDLARNLVRNAEGRTLVEKLWKKITQDCNAEGPPTRNVNAWKKVWSDFKFFLKKKLRKNEIQQRGTGGGAYKQYSFSPLEEKVIELFSMRFAVNGMVGVKSFGFGCSSSNKENVPSTTFVDNNHVDIMIEEYTPDTETDLNISIADNVQSSGNQSQLKTDTPPEIESSTPFQATTRPGLRRPRRTKAELRNRQIKISEDQARSQSKFYEDISASLKRISVHTRNIKRLIEKTYKVEEQRLELEKLKVQMKKEAVRLAW